MEASVLHNIPVTSSTIEHFCNLLYNYYIRFLSFMNERFFLFEMLNDWQPETIFFGKKKTLPFSVFALAALTWMELEKFHFFGFAPFLLFFCVFLY